MKLSPVVKKESFRIAVGCFSLMAIMLFVFFIFKQFSSNVLIGAVISTTLASLNFFLMCVSKQKELEMQAKRAKLFSVFSYNVRNLIMLGIIIIGYTVFKLNIIALLAPLLFPRITILVLTFTIYKKGGE